MWRELPPTSGMPLTGGDLFASAAANELESRLAQIIGLPAVELTSSATAALVIALEYLKTCSQPSRRRVILPGVTCPLVPIAVARAGLEIVVCDTEEHSFSFDARKLRDLVDERTLAVIPTHLGGFPVDVQSVLSAAKPAGAFVIEDAAQALGATIDGVPLGTIGDIGMFSLTAGKGLTIFQGGFAAAKDPAMQAGLADTARCMTQHNGFTELKRIIEMVGYTAFYNPAGLVPFYGWNLKTNLKRGKFEEALGDVFDFDVEIASVGDYRRKVGAAASRRFAEFLRDNQTRGRRRAQLLNQLPGLHALTDEPTASYAVASTQASWPSLVVVFDQPDDCRRALGRLWTSGLGVTKLFAHALGGYSYLQSLIGSPATPEAEQLCRRTLTVTNSAYLSDSQFAFIVDILAEITSSTTGNAHILSVPATL